MKILSSHALRIRKGLQSSVMWLLETRRATHFQLLVAGGEFEQRGTLGTNLNILIFGGLSRLRVQFFHDEAAQLFGGPLDRRAVIPCQVTFAEYTSSLPLNLSISPGKS
jgi:hypothetical protein